MKKINDLSVLTSYSKIRSVSIFVFLLTVIVSISVSCKSGGEIDNSMFNPPPTPQANIDNGTTATTQATAIVDSVKKENSNVEKNIESARKDIIENTDNLKGKIPESNKKEYAPIINKYYSIADFLLGTKSKTAENDYKLTEILSKLSDVKKNLEEAKSKDNEEKEVYKKNFEKINTELAGVKDENAKLKDANSKQLKERLGWIITSSIFVIGIAIAAAVASNNTLVDKISIGIAVAGVIVLGLAIFLTEILWIIQWLLVALAVITVAWVIYQLFIKKRAIFELVSTGETAKQALASASPSKMAEVFGDGAMHGQAFNIQSVSTEEIVTKVKEKPALKKAKKAS